ncbi:hypothetical protein PGT21_001506 [Puccinia graminis f. sp. tritici]|uniref:Uncharacterized protein n=1 Tax=Puccinia graminis f. sp. tritici TaxID=56615 RepID=A0A5B0PQ37_PUCGR|nr:hypothetical protein PGTUg99_006939 [Puccinia graminis f. sp. tritici]KAA1103817.1 hypothetical protein PGT21_001506 [Puccinia graminis f. sp. tritici]
MSSRIDGPPLEDGQSSHRYNQAPFGGDLKTIDLRRSASQKARYDERSLLGRTN